MKFKVIIDTSREEETIVYAHRHSKLVDDIEQLVTNDVKQLIGYSDQNIVNIKMSDVVCFTIEDGKVYALTLKEKLWLKLRLYQIEETVDQNFVKINQSCIANIKMISRFTVTFSGSLVAVFKNGYTDYVSRRQLKTVKERFGFNL